MLNRQGGYTPFLQRLRWVGLPPHIFLAHGFGLGWCDDFFGGYGGIWCKILPVFILHFCVDAKKCGYFLARYYFFLYLCFMGYVRGITVWLVWDVGSVADGVCVYRNLSGFGGGLYSWRSRHGLPDKFEWGGKVFKRVII